MRAYYVIHKIFEIESTTTVQRRYRNPLQNSCWNVIHGSMSTLSDVQQHLYIVFYILCWLNCLFKTNYEHDLFHCFMYRYCNLNLINIGIHSLWWISSYFMFFRSILTWQFHRNYYYLTVEWMSLVCNRTDLWKPTSFYCYS